MSGQTSEEWLPLPLDIELTVDANRLSGLVSTVQSAERVNNIMAAPNSRWVINYTLDLDDNADSASSVPHDIRLAAIEMVMAAEILDRVAKLLSEAMAVNMGTTPPTQNYSLGGDGIYRLTSGYIESSFRGLSEPWPPKHIAVFDWLRFEFLEAHPGSSKFKLRLWLAATAVAGFIGFAANLSTVADAFEKKVPVSWVVTQPNEAEKQRIDKFSKRLLDFQLNQVNHGDVTELQRNLSYLGFFPGAFDGKYGPITRDAILDFEKAHNLSPLGYKDPALHGEIVNAVIEQWQKKPAPKTR